MKIIIDECYHRSLKSIAITFFFFAKIISIQVIIYLLKGNQAKKFGKLFIKSKLFQANVNICCDFQLGRGQGQMGHLAWSLLLHGPSRLLIVSLFILEMLSLRKK